MRNIIRADIYRILRGKDFYVTTVLLIALIILQMVANNAVQIMTVSEVDGGDGFSVVEGATQPAGLAGDEIGYGMQIGGDPVPIVFTGTEAMESADILLYFLLVFIIFIAASDFSAGTVKNVLASGTPRVKLYLSKLILTSVFCFIILLLNVVIPIITMGIVSMTPSFEGELNIQFASIAKAFLGQLFLCLAVTCVGIFFVFALKKTAAVNGAFIAFCLVPLILIFTLYQINNNLQFLFDYEIISLIRMLAVIDAVPTTDIIRAFAVGAVYILASTIGGIALFKRAEIK